MRNQMKKLSSVYLSGPVSAVGAAIALAAIGLAFFSPANSQAQTPEGCILPGNCDGDDNGEPTAAPALCGAGACGAGVAGWAPLSLLGLGGFKLRSSRRRTPR